MVTTRAHEWQNSTLNCTEYVLKKITITKGKANQVFLTAQLIDIVVEFSHFSKNKHFIDTNFEQILLNS